MYPRFPAVAHKQHMQDQKLFHLYEVRVKCHVFKGNCNVTLTSKRAKDVSRNMNVITWVARVQREEILEKQVEKTPYDLSEKKEIPEDFNWQKWYNMHLSYIVQ